MLFLGAYRQFPDLFVDRHEERYLTATEAEMSHALQSANTRRSWLLTAVTAKTLAQRYLSVHYKVFVPLNALGVMGIDPAAQHARLTLDPEPEFSTEAVDKVCLLAHQSDSACLCGIEEEEEERTFGVALEPIEPGFPFFNEDPLRPEEVDHLSTLHPDHMNEVVSTYQAVKRAVLAALDQPFEIRTYRQILVSRVHPTGEVSLACDAKLAAQRRFMAWTEVSRRFSIGYATAFPADKTPDRERILDDLYWAGTDKNKDTPFAPRAHRLYQAKRY